MAKRANGKGNGVFNGNHFNAFKKCREAILSIPASDRPQFLKELKKNTRGQAEPLSLQAGLRIFRLFTK
ncbi:MAG TPA: hypothetical protein VJI74_00335 [Candidatus Paceibacterota bacterium]